MRTAALAIACCLGAAPAAVASEPVPATAATVQPLPIAAPAASPSPSPKPHAEASRAAHGRVCFSQAETREKIAQRRLTDPLAAMRSGRAEGEALRTRLCRWKQDELVYEVYVLRRDGRIVRLYWNAQNGKAVSAAELSDHK